MNVPELKYFFTQEEKEPYIIRGKQIADSFAVAR